MCSLQTRTSGLIDERGIPAAGVGPYDGEKLRNMWTVFVAVSSFYSKSHARTAEQPIQQCTWCTSDKFGMNNCTVQKTAEPRLSVFVQALRMSRTGHPNRRLYQLKTAAALSKSALHLTGGHTEQDQRFVTGQLDRLKKASCLRMSRIFHDLERSHRIAFLKNLSSTDSAVIAESIRHLSPGISGMRCPVVQTGAGAFPELVHKLQAALFISRIQPMPWPKRLIKFLSDPPSYTSSDIRGRKMWLKYFSIDEMAQKL